MAKYERPKIVDYGTLLELTQAGSVSNSDVPAATRTLRIRRRSIGEHAKQQQECARSPRNPATARGAGPRSTLALGHPTAGIGAERRRPGSLARLHAPNE